MRYGELGLKSPKVKRRFQKALLRNIEDAFLKKNTQCISSMDWGRIYVHTDNDDLAEEILKRTFGVTSFSKVIETSSDMEEICRIAAQYSQQVIPQNSTFAVRARRTGKHDYSSQDIAKQVGEVILTANKEKNITVNLSKPDITIFVEVRHNRAFIFNEKIQGVGGFPVGTQGKVLAVISDRKSIYAAWLLMKRGCRTKLFCLGEGALVLAKALEPWQLNIVPVVIEASDNNMDRALYVAKKIHAEALVLGDTLLEFEKRAEISAEIPVFYPLIGMDKEMIEKGITFLSGDGP